MKRNHWVIYGNTKQALANTSASLSSLDVSIQMGHRPDFRAVVRNAEMVANFAMMIVFQMKELDTEYDDMVKYNNE